jgi:DNA-binding LacI/PurR family transcriptional regulator
MNKVSLTSIEQEKAAIAIRAAEILTSEPEDWKKLEGESLLLLPRLEIRNSTRSVQV